MDRNAVLSQIPVKHHATADALAASGFDWSLVLVLIQKILEALLSRPKAAASSHCDEHVKEHLRDTCDSACATLCQAVAACEAAGCCD